MRRGKPGTRVAGGVSLLAAMTTAAALTGAAFFTVSQAGCDDPGAYSRHGSEIELIGGCVDQGELPGTGRGQSGGTEELSDRAPEHYRP